MWRYALKRLVMIIPVVFGVLVIMFVIQAVAPGDAVDQLLDGSATEEQKEELREELGLNDPYVVQFGRYVFRFVTKLDLGTSYKTGLPVRDELLSRFPVTIALAFGSVFIGILFGVPLGVISAVKQYTWVDSFILVISMIAVSMPSFWLALLCVILFSVKLGWLPASGIIDPLGWILPILITGFATMSSITRMTRSSMLEVIRQDYIRTARAKGLKDSTVNIRHALRSALLPIIASVGNIIGIQLGGVVVIENIFALPGLGRCIVEAISARNYPVVCGGVVLLAITFSLLNLIVDLLYAFVDPRMKSEFEKKGARSARALRRRAAREGGAANG